MRHVFLAVMSMFFSISSQAALLDRDWQTEGGAGITYHAEQAWNGWMSALPRTFLSIK